MKSISEKYRRKEILHYVAYVVFMPLLVGICVAAMYLISLMNANAGKLTARVVVPAILFIGVSIGCIWVMIRAIISLASPSRAKLGKSILSQMDGTASLSDLRFAIDADMDRGCTDFGVMHIGREWIIGEEALLISNVIGFFFWETEVRGRTGSVQSRYYIINIVDTRNEVHQFRFTKKETFEKIVNYLYDLLYWAARGNIDEFNVFMGMSDDQKKKYQKPADTLQALSEDAELSGELTTH